MTMCKCRNTLPKIAREKAGIIKSGMPVVISEAQGERWASIHRSSERDKPHYIRRGQIHFRSTQRNDKGWNSILPNFHTFRGLSQAMSGKMATVLTAVGQLRNLGYNISTNRIMMLSPMSTSLTGLMGRWRNGIVSRLILRHGHNTGGIQYIVRQLQNESYQNFCVLSSVWSMTKTFQEFGYALKCRLLFQASIPRALRGKTVSVIKAGLTRGSIIRQFNKLWKSGEKKSRPDDLIFVGGSTFIVADLLKTMLSQQITSISTNACFGNSLTANADPRPEYGPELLGIYFRSFSPKRDISANSTVVFTICSTE